jgi:hypothetical protein
MDVLPPFVAWQSSKPVTREGKNMIHVFSVVFTNGDAALAGRFYRNTVDLTQKQPSVLVTGAWLTVKEQMADTYARVLAELGYTGVYV